MTSSRFDGCQNPSDKQPSTNNIVPSTNTSNHSANNNNTPTTSTADDSLENQAKAKPKRRSVVNPKRSKLAPGPRQETAKTRKDHACDDCRARKVRCKVEHRQVTQLPVENQLGYSPRPNGCRGQRQQPLHPVQIPYRRGNGNTAQASQGQWLQNARRWGNNNVGLSVWDRMYSPPFTQPSGSTRGSNGMQETQMTLPVQPAYLQDYGNTAHQHPAAQLGSANSTGSNTLPSMTYVPPLTSFQSEDQSSTAPRHYSTHFESHQNTLYTPSSSNVSDGMQHSSYQYPPIPEIQDTYAPSQLPSHPPGIPSNYTPGTIWDAASYSSDVVALQNQHVGIGSQIPTGEAFLPAFGLDEDARFDLQQSGYDTTIDPSLTMHLPSQDAPTPIVPNVNADDFGFNALVTEPDEDPFFPLDNTDGLYYRMGDDFEQEMGVDEDLYGA